VEILPVVLDGTTTLIRRNRLFNWHNRITVRVLPPVPVERIKAMETHELLAEVQESMCKALAEVRATK
jgi:1-acyl-sn-glycerol-3-phosphate acyltransferase